MKHLAIICSEFFKFAIDRDWWKNLSKEEQQQYILQHKRTKLKPTQQNEMLKIFSNIPKEWKEQLVNYKVNAGERSNIEQLPDAMRPRLMKQVFDDGKVGAIVAFTTQSEPAFFITRGYDQDKFQCERYKDTDGYILTGHDAFVKETKRQHDRLHRGHVIRGHNYDVTDLRMSKIVENLPDLPYKMFVIKHDEPRQELHQMREGLKTDNRKREIQTKLIAKAIKPIYDYYSAKLQASIDELKNESVPKFSDVINASRYSNVMKDTSKITENIKSLKDKLSSLSYSISRAKGMDLPAEGQSYSKNVERSKQHIHEFLDEIKDLKKRFEEDYYKAITFKKREAMDTINYGSELQDANDAADSLNDIGLNDIANKVRKNGIPENKESKDALLSEIVNAEVKI